jgi:hypothetical protein
MVFTRLSIRPGFNINPSILTDGSISDNLKGFCLYHKQDYDRRLSENDRQILLEHHGKTLHILPSLIGSL